jgi:hypothetical protein
VPFLNSSEDTSSTSDDGSVTSAPDFVSLNMIVVPPFCRLTFRRDDA